MPDRPRLLEPSRLAPVEVDLRRVVLVGTLAWLLGAVVTTVLAATAVVPWVVVHVCLAGVALGGLGLLWVRGRTDAG